MTSQSQKAENKFYPTSKMKYIKKGLIAISILVFITACSKGKGTDSNSNPNDCSTASKTFATDVKQIIQASCASAGCHGTGSSRGPGELTSYAQIFSARTAIRSAVISGAMPKNGSLTTAQKNSIICWIDNGALDN